MHSGIVRIFALFIILLLIAPSNATSEQVENAIKALRQQLQDKNNQNPILQYTLGLLLESCDDSDLSEMATLFWQVGTSRKKVPVSKRIDSFCRGARAFDAVGKSDHVLDCYQQALNLAQNGGEVYEILKQAVPILLSSTGNDDMTSKQMTLCSELKQKYPTEPSVHQFEGSLWRLKGDATKSYLSYHLSTTLKHNDTGIHVESYILASAAARKAGLDIETQLEYLNLALKLSLTGNDRVMKELHNAIGIAHKHGGNREEAIKAFRKTLDIDPKDGHALVHLASLEADITNVPTLEYNYIEELFDGYSSRFENELVNDLHYKGHLLVVGSLLKAWGASSTCDDNQKTVLDLGCGTGLVSALLKENNSNISIIGVDLSSKMVKIAKERIVEGISVYSEVVQLDALSFLTSLQPNTITAVVASDFLLYVGDFDDILKEIVKALVKEGFFVFTVELIKTSGMRLLKSGRFGHSRAYIEKLAARYELRVVEWKEETLRKQRGEAVAGAVVCLQKI
mmetsp:Transcript_11855/g.18194  ORF Transcript_11855/g.18194 Transcript_11855/m.18194 type:complete len:511 (+) Transcript_11855:105-1637(+)